MTRKTLRWTIPLGVLLALAPLLAPDPARGHAVVLSAPAQSGWHVRTSLGFDALCALNILSGDPYYMSQYPADTATFSAPRYAAARAASVRLKRVIKDEGGGIISAFLTLILSGGPDSTVDDLVSSVRDPGRLERSFRQSAHWNAQTWATFERVRPDVLAALEGLRSADFETDWRARFSDAGTSRVALLLDSLARFDVIAEHERLLGRPREAAVEVILLYYSRPHGIRIQGDRFLTNVGYPVTVVLRNAAHELFHPPYEVEEPRVAEFLQTLGKDPLVRHVVATHNRSFGYNTVEGYIEENVVQALEQLVAERLGFATPAAQRWRDADGGMHLFAAALYHLMQENGFSQRGGSATDWLIERVRAGDLRPMELQRRARAVLGDSAVNRWTPTSAEPRN